MRRVALLLGFGSSMFGCWSRSNDEPAAADPTHDPVAPEAKDPTNDVATNPACCDGRCVLAY